MQFRHSELGEVRNWPFQNARATPNDRKLSDTPERRGACMVGGKAVAEAGAVTRRRVRCSAWLGDIDVFSLPPHRLSEPFTEIGP